jgi:arylsulfatase B
MLGEEEVPERLLIMHIQQRDLDPKMAAVMQGPWRLLWSDSLFNIEQDLAQQDDVSEQHPEVFLQMWKQYQETFGDLHDAAENAHPEVIGSRHQEEVILDSSYWLQARADGQPSVRQAVTRLAGPEGAPWKVYAEATGRYQITLRRWPVESGLALTDGAEPFHTQLSGKPLPAGVAFPIDHATLSVNHQLYTGKPAKDDPTAITIEVDLEKGEHLLHGTFRDKHGKALCGTFYAYVRKL